MMLRMLAWLLFVPVVVAQTSSVPPGPSVLVFEREYHLEKCPRLVGQSPTPTPLADALRANAGPCPVCQPSRENREIQEFATKYVVVISREVSAAREAAAAEERKKKALEPLVRVTEAQARQILTKVAASPAAVTDPKLFRATFLNELRAIAPDFDGAVLMGSDELSIMITGPLDLFIFEASERVRKFEPLSPPPTWSPSMRIVVSPSTIDAPDIERIVVQRNGTIVPPLTNGLKPEQLVTRLGATRMVNAGIVTYSLTAFDPEPGVTVNVIAIPKSGNNISRSFGPLELRAIQ